VPVAGPGGLAGLVADERLIADQVFSAGRRVTVKSSACEVESLGTSTIFTRGSPVSSRFTQPAFCAVKRCTTVGCAALTAPKSVLSSIRGAE